MKFFASLAGVLSILAFSTSAKEHCLTAIKHQPAKVVLKVRLDSAQVIGINPVNSTGADVKSAIDIGSRLMSRKYIELRGTPLKVIKGSGKTALTTFYIETQHLNNPMFHSGGPASNIPDLKIGNDYVIIKQSEKFGTLFRDCIFETNSSFVKEHFRSAQGDFETN